MELNRRWQLSVRLAAAPWGECGVAGQTVQARLVAEARQMQNALAARGINSVRSNREAQWLAAQPD